MSERMTNPMSEPERWRNPAFLCATLGGIGTVPRAPGTWGSLVALPLGWLLITYAGQAGLAAATLLMFGIGVWSCSAYGRLTGTHDASACVIDELVGQWIVLLVTPPEFVWYLAAFAAFRLCDIWKPWPTGMIDRRVAGGTGVMLDDVAAGVQAALIILAAEWVFAWAGAY